MSRAKAWFIGGGPGAEDLLTVRAARVISDADIVIWGANLVMEDAVRENARPDARLMPWPPATMDELLEAYSQAKENDLVVARLVGGDPAVYVDMSQEVARVRELELPHEIVPGVGALSAAAAILGGELVTAHSERSLLITSPKAAIEQLADRHEATAIYMAGAAGEDGEGDLGRRLLDAGYPPDTPCAVARSLSWPGEELVRCRLDELGELLAEDRFDRHSIALVGPTLPIGTRT